MKASLPIQLREKEKQTTTEDQATEEAKTDPNTPQEKRRKIPRKRMPRSKISRKASQPRLSIWSLRPPNPRSRVRFLLAIAIMSGSDWS